jgi:hypothetical protein
MKPTLFSALLFLSSLGLCHLSFAAAPFIEKKDLFTAGEDPAYSLYHIPGVVVTAKGTVLAWCEARKRAAGVSDWDDIRILLRRRSGRYGAHALLPRIHAHLLPAQHGRRALLEPAH